VRRKALFLVLVLVPLLTACGGPDRPGPSPTTAPSPPVERTTVTFACYDYELGSYRDLARQFEETQPGVAVQVLSIDEILGPDSGELPPEDVALQVMSAADTARPSTRRASPIQRRGMSAFCVEKMANLRSALQ